MINWPYPAPNNELPDADQLRELLATGIPASVIGKQYGVSARAVGYAAQGPREWWDKACELIHKSVLAGGAPSPDKLSELNAQLTQIAALIFPDQDPVI